ncbi:MAG: hypothetical protein LW834_08010 [Cyanobium sp. 49614_E6]|jgi:hypothetical protein|nr:hypothetical protein [Cyanobium sp. 49614_E6]MCE2836893.1 hypothetical protein [Cyanobium sp. 49614_E6]
MAESLVGEWQINHLEESAKQERLELLYEQSGRGDRSHPLHALYTGLIQEAPSAQVPGPSAPEPATASPNGAEQQLVGSEPNP